MIFKPEMALCLGGGPDVWDEVRRLEMRYGQPWDGVVIACNDIGAHWPRPLHHWASLHPNRMQRWIDLRQVNGYSPALQLWSGRERNRLPGMKYLEPWNAGSSGMLTVQVAEYVGCTKAILCGIPMTSAGHFAESKEGFGPVWYAAAAHWAVWKRMKPRLEYWVRSMSGNTAELLGEPTADWLHEYVRNMS